MKWLNLIEIQCVIALLLYAASFWFPEGFLLTLVHSFVVQVLFMGLGLTLLLIWRRKWPHLVVSVLSVCVLAWQLPEWEGGRGVGGEPELRIAHFNVLKFNYDTESTVDAALASGADVISFQEVDERWEAALVNALAEVYPHYYVESRSDCYGLGVFSKQPLTNVSLVHFEGFPNIVGDIRVNGVDVHFIASHTRAPIAHDKYEQRNKQLKQIADYLIDLEGPKVAIGDYNSVPWDSRIVEFINDTSMSDSRKSLTATYPSGLFIARIPIDYIFHSDDITCVGFEAIGGTSSDHLGVIGSYLF